jgi:hypothetical protein
MPGMVRRWLIRWLCLVPLACVVGVGIASYFWGISWTPCVGGRLWNVGVVHGLGSMAEAGPRGSARPILLVLMRGAKTDDWLLVPTTLGFYGGAMPGYRDSFMIVFPLWIPTLLLAAINVFVWRKTRGTGMGRGFPVEMRGDVPSRE